VTAIVALLWVPWSSAGQAYAAGPRMSVIRAPRPQTPWYPPRRVGSDSSLRKP
jgi:hypothetical protein